MPEGTQVLAAAGGRVVEALNGNPGATCPFSAPQLTQQRRVTIEHTLQGGTVVRTLYDHLSSISVSNNQMVIEGQLIGRSGQTGCARGPHLHFDSESRRSGAIGPG
ncbi:MAG: M23 family metallopeptidase [Gemmatimonadales bacterium]